jgi:hypothetical protein
MKGMMTIVFVGLDLFGCAVGMVSEQHARSRDSAVKMPGGQTEMNRDEFKTEASYN